jgi:HTH-type transcriptional regulator/antitoxin HigA
MRHVARIELPSTSAPIIRVRSAVLNLFILTIMLERAGIFNSAARQFADLRRSCTLWHMINNPADEFATPGQLIAHLLEKEGISQRVLAIVLGVHETSINKLIAGKRPLTPAMALQIEEMFGVEAADADRLMALQTKWEIAHARILHRSDPARTTRAALFGGLPVSEMIQRGWLDAPNVKDVPAVETALKVFFNEPSLDSIEILPHAPKKTNVAIAVTPAQLAWLYRVKQIASEVIVPRYTLASGRAAVGKLQALLSAPEEARKVPRILHESGIRFVIVESLTAAKIDGVCLWLNEVSPVIGMTFRYDRIDNFWFVLRHELEHVIAGHGQGAATLDAELEGDRAGTGSDITEEERIANQAAVEFCVPQDKLDSFIARKEPFFSERDILGFARTIDVHPGLIAGQLQHRIERYDRFRSHLAKVKHIVAPGAAVDGWGDVFPVGT